MRRQPLSSTTIRSVGYDPQSRMLEIEFHSDGVYQYEDVGQDTYHGLLAAPSKGHFFDERIRDRYAWQRVEEG